MSKSNLSPRIVVTRVALFTVIGAFLLIFTAAGTSAAGFSFLDSVKEYFGLPVFGTATQYSTTVGTSARIIPNDLPLNVYGTGWLRLSETESAIARLAAAEPFYRQTNSDETRQSGITVGHSYHNDTSPALRDMRQMPIKPHLAEDEEGREANKNPSNPKVNIDSADAAVQSAMAPDAMPTPVLNFDGIPYPGVACNCAPPDTDGEVGATQYVQAVNNGYQVFNKTTGASVLGPSSIVSLWAGFGGVCQTNGNGDPVVLYDQLAGRWLISQFAGASVPTDECIAISTTSDATGSYNRYAFHLGANFFDYPHLGIWPDGYYMVITCSTRAERHALDLRLLRLTGQRCSPVRRPRSLPRELPEEHPNRIFFLPTLTVQHRPPPELPAHLWNGQVEAVRTKLFSSMQILSRRPIQHLFSGPARRLPALLSFAPRLARVSQNSAPPGRANWTPSATGLCIGFLIGSLAA